MLTLFSVWFALPLHMWSLKPFVVDFHELIQSTQTSAGLYVKNIQLTESSITIP